MLELTIAGPLVETQGDREATPGAWHFSASTRLQDTKTNCWHTHTCIIYIVYLIQTAQTKIRRGRLEQQLFHFLPVALLGKPARLGNLATGNQQIEEIETAQYANTQWNIHLNIYRHTLHRQTNKKNTRKGVETSWLISFIMCCTLESKLSWNTLHPKFSPNVPDK